MTSSIMVSTAASKVTAEHLARTAYLYVRQSTLRQVHQQHRVDAAPVRAAPARDPLGWPVEQIVVIDTDQGQSGASAADREGFQRLVAEVGLGQGRDRARPRGLAAGAQQRRLAPAA